MSRLAWLSSIVITIFLSGRASGEDRVAVTVRGLARGPLRERLVSWSVPNAERGTQWSVTQSDDALPSQLIDDGARLVWKWKAGQGSRDSVEFRLNKVESPPDISGGAVAVRTAEAVELRVSGHPLVTYHAAVRLPMGVNPVFRRSGHLHPLQTPAGLVLTDEFPEDHRHQHALFFAWVNTEFDGRHVDFWNQSQREGTVRHGALQSTFSGAILTGLNTQLEHVALDAEGDALVLLREDWQVSGWSLDGRHVLDIESRQRAATEKPLRVKEYHYGGFGIRGSSEWGKQCAYLTSNGDDRLAGNHTHCRWVRLTGTIDGKACGLAVLSHPANFRAPQAVRLHSTMPYFAFSPCVDGEFTITNEADYVSRYRVLAFDGSVSPEKLNAAWEDYGQPLIAE